MNYAQPKQISEKTKLPNRGLEKVLKNTGMTLIWPIACFVVAIILSATSNKALFSNATQFWLFVGTVLTTFIAIWALNTNLNSGRMDFSLGATGILAAYLASRTLGGADVAYNTYQIIFSYIGLTVLYGGILGVVGSIVYIVLKLPAIVVSLGMCLVFEGVAVAIAGKSGNDIKYRATAKLAGQFMSQPVNLIIILVIVAIVMSLVICYSRFGYNKNALVYNQKIACDTGINEVVSCIACYVIAGALIGLYQSLTDLSNTAMNITVNLGSSGTVFRNFLPIFIGSMMMRYSNQIISSLSATVAITLLNRGLTNAAFLTSNITNLITSFMVLLVLVYMVDKYPFLNWLKMRKWLAKQKRLGLDRK